MLQDKMIVNDYLSTINASLSRYGSIIAETDNEALRQTFIQMRNADESRQHQLYKYAAQKGHYKPASTAPVQEIQQLRSQLQQELQPMSHQMFQQVPQNQQGFNSYQH
ncbi:spore coat protein CotF [Oikeobacillus pervagus]|uniref:Spore coat protein CotF n=1 Tax=Oikeobacillus pervagus TaxID=1325931 RepID=A0AAJ1SZ30_9BACI|nr:spore coat protein CotF [Oikeobacillus pervagus]